MKNSNKITILTAAVLLAASGGAFANTYTVTNGNDSGAGSFAQAVLDANANSGADTINFADGLSVIKPITGIPRITGQVTIDGQGTTRAKMELNGEAIRQSLLTVNGTPYPTAVHATGSGGLGIVTGILAVVPGNGTNLSGNPRGGLSEACSGQLSPTNPLPNLTGKIALISRGTCTLVSKINNVKNAGAVGAIVVNTGAGAFDMGFQNVISFMASVNDRAALIAADGTTAVLQPAGSSTALTITGAGSSGTTIRNMVINNWKSRGIEAFSANNLLIEGNYIGTDSTGMSAQMIGKIHDAIFLIPSSGSTIQNNVISGNTTGIFLGNSDSISVLNNKMGTNKNGDLAAGTAIPNVDAGVWLSNVTNSIIDGNTIANTVWIGIFGDGSNNTISNNTIANNGNLQIFGDGGMGIGMPGGVNNAFIHNSIYGSHDVGIAFWFHGSPDVSDITINDPRDSDTVYTSPPYADWLAGQTLPNHWQNYPVLSAESSKINPALAIAVGSLYSEPNTDYLIEVFADAVNPSTDPELANPVCHVATGYTSAACGADSFLSAEGQFVLGSFVVHTDANGFAPFRQTLTGYSGAVGVLMTSIATKMVDGVPRESSQFSEAVNVGVGSPNAYVHAAGAAGGDSHPAPEEEAPLE